jgi:hypothetical protein
MEKAEQQNQEFKHRATSCQLTPAVALALPLADFSTPTANYCQCRHVCPVRTFAP